MIVSHLRWLGVFELPNKLGVPEITQFEQEVLDKH